MVGRTLSALRLSSLAPPPAGEGPSASGFHPGDCCLRVIDTRLVRYDSTAEELDDLGQKKADAAGGGVDQGDTTRLNLVTLGYEAARCQALHHHTCCGRKI